MRADGVPGSSEVLHSLPAPRLPLQGAGGCEALFLSQGLIQYPRLVLNSSNSPASVSQETLSVGSKLSLCELSCGRS